MASAASRSRHRRYVLDANALTGFFENRRMVAEKIRHLLGEALRHEEPLLMSAVNWGEVFYVSWRRHGETKAREAEATLWEMPITVVAVDQKRATRAGALKEKHGLSYADALAAELTIEQGAWMVTADPEFSKVGKGLSIYSLPRYEK
jgi:predicted nucleic acid-binding protein